MKKIIISAGLPFVLACLFGCSNQDNTDNTGNNGGGCGCRRRPPSKEQQYDQRAKRSNNN